MKNHANTQPQRTTHPRPPYPARTHAERNGPRHRPYDAGGRTTDPIQQHAAQRRLYTDFLALAFYPGMPPRATERTP